MLPALDAPTLAPILAALAVFLSLIGGILGRICASFAASPLRDRLAQRTTSGLMVLSALLANWVLVQIVQQGHGFTVALADWIAVGDFSLQWAL
ncbi:MAG: hypothetical protein FJX22_04520, partial [Alphaproteobacteria bacterium]|nr:hypothetical protein [Alphaproteobacteria bacterium]